MAVQTRFIPTIVSTLAVGGALILGLKPETAEAAPSAYLTAALETIADVFGDEFGHIVMRSQEGATVVLALEGRGHILYTSGNAIGYDDTLAFCQQTASGGLNSCEVVDERDYDCYWNEIESWCSCGNAYDCVAMFRDMCTEGGDSACDESGCSCDA